MKYRRLLALSVLALAFGCRDQQLPTSPAAPGSGSASVSDGAHGGNPDFFFLPPLFKVDKHDPNFEVGEFNNTLQPNLTVVICELNTTGAALPTDGTQCKAGAPVKTFAPGTVNLVDLPGRTKHPHRRPPHPDAIPNGFHPEEWWMGKDGPTDGFYYVMWDTRQANLTLDRFYRIKVSITGSALPLGFADIEVKDKGAKWKYSKTDDVIEMVDDVMLPIPFRVENHAFCADPGLCETTTVPGVTPNGEPTIVQVDGGGGSIAGASFPSGWLPTGPGRPTSVVVTISEVNTGGVVGGPPNPCHASLPLVQFRGCFKYTTTPALEPINEAGDQFAEDVTVAVCYELEGTGDPREKFAELWASDVDEPPHPLDDVSDASVLAAAARDCSTTPVIGLRDSNPLTRFASAGWRNVKGGLGKLFGVNTAYAVDLGLGGLTKRFSNVSPVLSADIVASTSTELTLAPGATTTSTARIVGNNHHASHALATGIGGLAVTFTVSSGNGTIRALGSEGPPLNTVTVITNTNPIDESPVSGGGFAPVNWTVPETPGTYTLTANGPALDGPVTFTAVVPTAPGPNFIGLAPNERRMLSMQTGSSIQVGVTGDNSIGAWQSSAANKVTVGATGLVTAITGGESIEGGDSSFVSSILTTQEPGPTLFVDGFTFDLFPRTTTLVWNAVQGAVSYQVVTEFGNGSGTNPFCSVPAECAVWTQQVAGSTTTNALMFTFDFVGAQPGRWRVTALNAAGGVISTSPFVYFAYRI
jgi:hypothetical protein